MRLMLAVMLTVLTIVPSASARLARDGFGTSSRCHCDRYLNPHYTERTPPARGGGYRGGGHRRY